MLFISLFILFFLSGFTGLLYEVVWTRIFGLIFGNTTLAVSTVLSAYMLGLALGSIIIGKYADKYPRPLRLYAGLELGVGVTAVIIMLIRPVLPSLFAVFFNLLRPSSPILYIIQFIICFFIMLPATFMMGGTLPALSKKIIREESTLGINTGRLYSINTFGAMLGTLVTGFILIPYIGVTQSIILAVGINVIISVSAYLLSIPAKKISTTVENIKQTRLITSSAAPKFLLLIAVVAASGFAALSYEILWSRILVFVLTNSVYAFSIMLTTFLAGIALGSAVGGQIADNIKNPIKTAGVIELGIGLGALLAGFTLIHLSEIHYSFFTPGPNSSWWILNFVRFAEAFLIMFVPTFFMGMLFPVAAKIIVPSVKKVGSGIGTVYFYNTLGGVFGSFLTGFVFIELIGTSAVMLGMVTLNIILGSLLLLWPVLQGYSVRRFAFFSSAVLLLAGVIILTPSRLFTNAFSHVESREYPLIDYEEGIEGTVTVHEKKEAGEEIKRIDIDGLNVAGTSFMLRTLQTLQGHLPAMMHSEPKDVLQIGFGTGQTSYSALLHPLKSYELIEISADVLNMAKKHFGYLNHNILDNPDMSVYILDGRNYVQYTDKSYDIIMNDANYAVATPSANLFTCEHFSLCKNKLNPGGIVSTWMTIDLDPEDFAIVLRTFHSVFPYCILWMAPNCINKQIVLMGSEKPFKFNIEKISQRFDNSSIKEDLAAVNIKNWLDLAGCILLDEKGIESIAGSAEINSDDNPVLEFSSHAIRSRDYCSYRNLGKIIYRRPDISQFLTGFPKKEAKRQKIKKRIDKYYAASRLLLEGILAAYQGRTSKSLKIIMTASKTIPESNIGSYFFKKTDMIGREIEKNLVYENKNAVIQYARYLLGLEKYKAAMHYLNNLKENSINNYIIQFELARCYIGLNKADSAKMMINKSIQYKTDFAGSWYLLGELQRKGRKYNKAVVAYNKALDYDPRMYEALNGRGTAYKIQQNHKKALSDFKKSISIMEYQPTITADMADCLLALGNIKHSIKYYSKALSMEPGNPRILFKLGNAFYLEKNFVESEKYFLEALRLDSLNAEIFYNLGNSFVMQENFQQAVKAFERALSIDKNNPDYFNNLALSYRELGDIDKALKILHNGLQGHPNAKQLRENYKKLKM
ncbi:MAG: fused MFS/spermidine synthase [bacterium]